jgi:prepilin-type N-terminal cleavage/methylation domain-containing protein
MKRRLQSIKTTQRGITLIELIIVVAIVSVVSMVTLFNYSNFSTNVSLKNLAQEVALSIRKAQTYATSVQAISGGSTTSYPMYGIAFSLATPSASVSTPSQKRFVLFADVDNDGAYDNGGSCGVPSTGSECLEGFGIATSDSIIQICSNVLGSCYTTSTGGSMIMTFRRPSPNATICVMPNASGACIGGESYGSVVVRSAKGLTQQIRVWNTGQISVQ